MTRYQLSKYGVPESTTSNIINRRTKIDDIKVWTLYKVSIELNLDMELTYSRLKYYENS